MKTEKINITKEWKELEKGASISLNNWENLKDFIWKMQMRIEDLEKSRENWKNKYKETVMIYNQEMNKK